MPDRYRYEKLTASDFERLVHRLAASEAEVGTQVVVQAGFTTVTRHLDANASLGWLSAMLEQNGKEIRLAARDAGHYLFATEVERSGSGYGG